jgi:RHS repeat-associated protein
MRAGQLLTDLFKDFQHLLRDVPIVATQNFDPVTDRLTSILAGTGNAVESFSYTYDAIGNVLTRADANESLKETFIYDNLNRLLSATVSATVSVTPKNFSYDPFGNLLWKSDVGTYTYPLAGSALPHAVSAVNGTINSTFTYDANGNLATGNNRVFTYFSFNKPSQVYQGSQGATAQNFLYDTEHARIWRAAPEGGTLYFDAFGMHVEWLNNGTWYDYISAIGGFVTMRVSGATTATRYFHTDNLGSISVITNETGAVVERDGYDAWGQRRFANGADGNPGASQTTRGFTGQEELSDVGLVHLNGRIYDPLLARTTSADPTVPDPLNGQAWNRYSYVVNNPLAFTDPSGYCFLGLCGSIGSFLHHLSVPGLAGSFTEIAAVLLAETACGPAAPVCAAAAAFISTTAVAGTSAGNLARGLKPGLIAAAEAVAFYEVGNATDWIQDAKIGSHAAVDFTTGVGLEAYAFNVTAHAAVGCAAAVASGGKCGPSALAGGVTSAAGPAINGHDFVFGLVANAALGGGVAVLGGGKFENGAITGAFGYLFNACGGKNGCAALGGAIGTVIGVGTAGACDIGTTGACVAANWPLIGAVSAAGVATGAYMDAMLAANDNAPAVPHGNSADSMRGTELYYLINNSSGEIDKIGITSNPAGRYSQDYLIAENVTYVPQAYYTWRYAAMVDENIRLTFYQFTNGQLPRLNLTTR